MGTITANVMMTLNGVAGQPERWHFEYSSPEMHGLMGRQLASSTALLLGLFLAAACDSPTHSGGNGGGSPAPTPTQPAAVVSVRVSPDTATLLSMGGHRMG